MLLLENMNSKQKQNNNPMMTIESIKRYEIVIEQLNQKVKTLEATNAKSNLNDQNVENLDWLVYHKYNKNLKTRL